MKTLTLHGMKIDIAAQAMMLADLPHPAIRECFFTPYKVYELVNLVGYAVRCRHCGVWHKKKPTPFKAHAIAEALLKHWQKQSLVCYSDVLKRWRLMTPRVR